MPHIDPSKEIERLLQFGIQNNLIETWDIIPTRNALLDLLDIKEPYTGEIEKETDDSPVDILNNLLDYSVEAGIIEDNTITQRDLLDAKIMGLLMPRQSEVVRNFYQTAKEKSIQQATEDYYAMSQASNYIRTDRIAKNLYWLGETPYGALEITINLSKPEKDPKEIAKAKSVAQSNYPKCLLCAENVGYPGRLNHPARQNHRVIPVLLSEEQWYLQYSPYVYYNEHSIIFNGEHVPMKISKRSFERIVDFIEQFPHYFVGSNADLPIVGGSILSHDHFQGGRHIFPMEKAGVEITFIHSDYPDVKASIVHWPMSVIRLSGVDKQKLIDLSDEILRAWREYSDPSVDILAYSTKDGETTPHNTITPIGRKNKAGEYEIDLVLRNNRTTDEYPDGIFHPHQPLHHIKKENIGLIEVMGLAVLPGRLSIELKEIEKVLTGEKTVESIESDDTLAKHVPWTKELINTYGTALSQQEAEQTVQKEVADKFLHVLLDAGVYKKDQKGMDGFKAFMHHIGFQEK